MHPSKWLLGWTDVGFDIMYHLYEWVQCPMYTACTQKHTHTGLADSEEVSRQHDAGRRPWLHEDPPNTTEDLSLQTTRLKKYLWIVDFLKRTSNISWSTTNSEFDLIVFNFLIRLCFSKSDPLKYSCIFNGFNKQSFDTTLHCLKCTFYCESFLSVSHQYYDRKYRTKRDTWKHVTDTQNTFLL